MNFEFDDVDDEELDFVQPHKTIPVRLNIVESNKGDDIDNIIDQIKKEFIDKYPKNYMGGLELDGRGCVFSLNEILKILDKYKKE